MHKHIKLCQLGKVLRCIHKKSTVMRPQTDGANAVRKGSIPCRLGVWTQGVVNTFFDDHLDCVIEGNARKHERKVIADIC